MAIEAKISVQKSLTIAEQLVYVVSQHVKLTIKLLRLSNVTGSAVTVRLYFAPPNGTGATTNAVLYDFSIAANEFIEFGEGQILYDSFVIRGSCSVDNAVNVILCGLES